MPGPGPLTKRHPVAATLLASWRRLTGGPAVRDEGRPTLLACSAGRDSSALALALTLERSATLVLAHIVHDLREESLALADRDAALALADRLQVPFAQAHVRVKHLPGNAESNARKARYAALADLALQHGCAFIATAHHADDQLETLLLRLARGAGPRGLRGIAAKRRLPASPSSTPLTLIRPALCVTSDQCRDLCQAAGWTWRDDHTNADLSRARALLRHRVLPALREVNPSAALHAARAAELLRLQHHRVLQSLAALPVTPGPLGARYARDTLRSLPAWLLAELLSDRARQLLPDHRADRISRGSLLQIVRRIRSTRGDPARFPLGAARVIVERDTVTIEPAGSSIATPAQGAPQANPPSPKDRT